MFVVDEPDTIRLVTQPDHAALSGQIARHWGNETFETLEPYASMIIASENHDYGWEEYDRIPHLDDDTGRPRDFRELPSEVWTDFYGAGVELAADIDLYAGLLVSLHAAGLRRQGYGLRTGIPDTHTDPVYARFVDDQERLQQTIMDQLQALDRFAPYATASDQEFLDEIHETGNYTGHCRTWRNYQLLQLFDVLSIYFCDNATLGETTIGPVPDIDTELTITPIDEMAVRIDPYPFDVSPLRFSTTGRYISKPIENQEAVTKAYYTSEPETLEFTVRT